MQNIDTSKTEALGFTVTRTNNDAIPYHLHGKRGAHYGLMRNINHPDRLFVINLRVGRMMAQAKGYEWFAEVDGELRPWA